MSEPDAICQWCEVAIPIGRGALCRACQRAEDEAQDDYCDDYMTREEEDAAILAWENNQARGEWEHYHPGEPCPEIELPHPDPERLKREDEAAPASLSKGGE